MHASVDRPLPFVARSDLEITPIDFSGRPFAVVKDPLALKYYRLTPEQHAVLLLLDGNATVSSVRRSISSKFPLILVEDRSVQDLILDLAEKSLVISRRTGASESRLEFDSKKRWKELWISIKNPFFLKLPGFNPQLILSILFPVAGLLFRWWIAAPTLVGVALAWCFVAAHFESIQLQLPAFQQFFGWPNLVWLWGTLAFSKAIHELGHGTACLHFGRRCHSIGIMLLLLSPTMYCDVSDSWTLRNKWKRMAVGAGGIYFEIVLASIAVLVWWKAHDGMAKNLALNVFFVSAATTVIFNANPFIRRYDGYYILSDFLEVPNLGRESQKLTSRFFGWLFFGERKQEDSSWGADATWLLFAYGLCAMVYRVLIMVVILGFLYRLLKPYNLESVGIVLTIAMIVPQLWRGCRTLMKKVSKAAKSATGQLRLWFWGSCLAMFMGFVTFVPVPWTVRVPFYLKHAAEVGLYNAVAGTVEKIHVSPGQIVEAGDSILSLRNDDLTSSLNSLQDRIETSRTALAGYIAIGDSEASALMRNELGGLLRELKTTSLAMNELTLVAPISGVVVKPAPVSKQSAAAKDLKLEKWSGTPLDSENLGAFCEIQTHVCTIRPSHALDAVAIVSQTDRELVPVHSHAILQLDHLPDDESVGELVLYSDDPQNLLTPSLSSKFGGALPTVTSDSGEQLLETSSAAIIRIPGRFRTTVPGRARGTARFVNRNHTLGFYIIRWMRTTFHFAV